MNRLLAAALVLLLTLAACARLKPDVAPDTVTDAASLVEFLRENNVELLEEGPFISPLLTVPGQAYTPLSGGALQVFKYPTEADALADMAQIERGRHVRTTPHLYRKADLVVLYWGDDPRVELALVRVFGVRIA